MKKTFVTKSQLEKIVKKYPTPFHLYDEKGIRENCRKLYKAFSWNKGFREYFAVKATPTPRILQILKEEGCGVDCASEVELMLADKCGFRGEEIMFSSNETTASEYELARKLGAIINLDDITHINFLDRLVGIPPLICCRYNPGGHFALGNTIMDHPCDAKYGMTPEQIKESYIRLQKLGAKEFGMHAFLVSGAMTNKYYPGATFKFINLSGGIGIPYEPEQKANNIAVIGEGVRRAFEKIMVPAGMGDTAIYTELGRFMLGPYGCLVTTAIHEKHTYKEYIGVDACAAHLMRPAIYGAYHHITVMGKERRPQDHMYDIVGSLCENNDKFAVDRMMPRIDIGDLLVIHDTGAHGFSMGYNYNGKLRSAEVLLREDGSAELIRRAETPEDYFATMVF